MTISEKRPDYYPPRRLSERDLSLLKERWHDHVDVQLLLAPIVHLEAPVGEDAANRKGDLRRLMATAYADGYGDRLKEESGRRPTFINRHDYARSVFNALFEPNASEGGEATQAQEKFKCKARQSSVPDPQDCDWPVCGCDPYADKVIAALQESGKL